MAELGYSLSSEEHTPLDLVRHAKMAEDCGFAFALVSDHYHPWTDRQGQSPFVWSVIGAIVTVTTRLRLGTGVTCPLIRTHPAVIAQAAATSEVMMPGRFFLGVGTGENLNEHVVGEGLARGRHPPRDARGGHSQVRRRRVRPRLRSSGRPRPGRVPPLLRDDRLRDDRLPAAGVTMRGRGAARGTNR
jgi:alkanesulfonate monooxygenase SsuD/methylene tetrahydromethanopterin reductase-like flavin-dependent oxidoreductase (luciferase family)